MNIRRKFSNSENESDIRRRILQHAIEWAMEAGKLQREKFRSGHIKMDTKSSIHDVVTEVDKACEDLIIGHISSHYPSHSVLGEETGEHQSTGDWEWVVDPLDGTNNYSQGLPLFCVSIGVRYKGETQVGVVYVPYLDELYTATLGEGASLNGRFIRVSRKTVLDECVLATGFPYDKGTNPINNLDNFSAIVPNLRGIRRSGSAAYDLCCVASGWLDGYWELNLKPWDVCAGELIVAEAGGCIQSFRDDRNISIVAGNKAVVSAVMDKLVKP
ncbi:MAG: inositol monophosphatase [Bacteroidales bacterium]|nr:inositol monophosphatase [Candidatus Liminaster caballi]